MDAGYWIEAFLRGLMCLLGILGNTLLALRSRPKSKLRTKEVLLINLAISNLITNYLVDLPDTMTFFVGHWFLGETFCGVFLFLSDLSETSSIFSTFFICLFWYKKLVGSLKRGGAPICLDSLHLIAILLAGSWVVAVVFSVPHFFFVQGRSSNDSQKECGEVFPSRTARHIYNAFYLTIANILPIVAIVFASIQIVITLLRNQMRIHELSSDLGTENALPHNRGTTIAPVKDNKTSDKEADLLGAPDTQSNQPGSCCDLPYAGPTVEQIRTSHYQIEISDSRASDLERPSQAPAKASPGNGVQVRAAKSVVAVATVFVVCWVTHLLLRISSDVSKSFIELEVANYIGSSYTCTMPYIFLYGERKLSCSCRR
ncbi:hypothetical protein DPEC_G00335600 [Dallia pectoralis]|uniref:Uncharacterized protein n=1 Tax=Dallia pectoralis TaxID=75939 RepID=A0ACC2F700_DALPE|nr:hypothetical protein DPEC_G00335600 [Dallia pectoralis]